MVLAFAAAAGRKIRVRRRAKGGDQQRDAEEGQQQDGGEAAQAIILRYSAAHGKVEQAFTNFKIYLPCVHSNLATALTRSPAPSCSTSIGKDVVSPRRFLTVFSPAGERRITVVLNSRKSLETLDVVD
jgi:hypothetical protein